MGWNGLKQFYGLNRCMGGFLDGSVVKNLPANAGDVD